MFEWNFLMFCWFFCILKQLLCCVSRTTIVMTRRSTSTFCCVGLLRHQLCPRGRQRRGGSARRGVGRTTRWATEGIICYLGSIPSWTSIGTCCWWRERLYDPLNVPYSPTVRGWRSYLSSRRTTLPQMTTTRRRNASWRGPTMGRIPLRMMRVRAMTNKTSRGVVGVPSRRVARRRWSCRNVSPLNSSRRGRRRPGRGGWSRIRAALSTTTTTTRRSHCWCVQYTTAGCRVTASATWRNGGVSSPVDWHLPHATVTILPQKIPSRVPFDPSPPARRTWCSNSREPPKRPAGYAPRGRRWRGWRHTPAASGLCWTVRCARERERGIRRVSLRWTICVRTTRETSIAGAAVGTRPWRDDRRRPPTSSRPSCAPCNARPYHPTYNPSSTPGTRWNLHLRRPPPKKMKKNSASSFKRCLTPLMPRCLTNSDASTKDNNKTTIRRRSLKPRRQRWWKNPWGRWRVECSTVPSWGWERGEDKLQH